MGWNVTAARRRGGFSTELTVAEIARNSDSVDASLNVSLLMTSLQGLQNIFAQHTDNTNNISISMDSADTTDNIDAGSTDNTVAAIRLSSVK